MLSGVCYVGLLDDSSLLYLIVVPSAVYLTVGLVFLVMGFASLAQVRTVMKRDGTRTDKLERLMLRIGEKKHIIHICTKLSYKLITTLRFMKSTKFRQ